LAVVVGLGTREEDGAAGRRRHTMGGRGRRKGNGEEGGATREGGLWADARGRKKIPEREGGENEKKLGGEHITAGSYYNPAVMLTYHRRVVLRTGGDMLASPPGPFGTGGDRLSPPVRNKPAVMGRLR